MNLRNNRMTLDTPFAFPQQALLLLCYLLTTSTLLVAVAAAASDIPYGLSTATVSYRGSGVAWITAPSSDTIAAITNQSLFSAADGSSLPTIYLFRLWPSLDAPVVVNQSDILSSTKGLADIRRIAIVSPFLVSNSQGLSSRQPGWNFTTEAEVLAAPDVTITMLSNFVCHCPVVDDVRNAVAAAAYRNASVSSSFGSLVTNARWGDDGSQVSYFQFHDTYDAIDTFPQAAGDLYQIVDPITNAHRYYLFDGMPGDSTGVVSLGLRTVYSVGTLASLTSVSEIVSPMVKTATSRLVHVSIAHVTLFSLENATNVSFTEALCVSNATRTGSSVGAQDVVSTLIPVAHTMLPMTRFTTSTLRRSKTRLQSNPLIIIGNMDVLLVDVAPGERTYTDCWSVVKIPVDALGVSLSTARTWLSMSQVTAHFNGSTAYLDMFFSGTFINAPLWKNGTTIRGGDVVGDGSVWMVWCRGTAYVAGVLDTTLPNGCAIASSAKPFSTNKNSSSGVAGVRLQRTNESSLLSADSDVFLQPPREMDDVLYFPYVGVAELFVDPTYSPGDALPQSVWSTSTNINSTTLISTSVAQSIPNYHYYNAPRKELTMTVMSTTSSMVLLDNGQITFSVANNNQLDATLQWSAYNSSTAPSPAAVTVVAQISVMNATTSLPYSPLVFGVKGVVPFEGILLVVYRDAQGSQCTRQVTGNLSNPSLLKDVTAANPLQLTRAVMRRSVVNSSLALDVVFGLDAMTASTATFSSVWISDRDGRVAAVVNCSVDMPTVLFPTSGLTGSSLPYGDYLMRGGVSTAMMWTPGSATTANTTTADALQQRADQRSASLDKLGFALVTLPTPIENSSSLATTATPPSPSSSLQVKAVRGTFRCDAAVSFSWAIDPSTSDMYVSVTTPSSASASMWFGIGFGQALRSNSDFIVSYQDPSNSSSVVVEDKKCLAALYTSSTGGPVCLRDVQQDAFFVNKTTTSATATTTWTFRRKLNTSDAHSSVVVDPDVQSLSSTLITSSSGSAGDRRAVKFLPFSGSATSFVNQDNVVGWAPLYRLRSTGSTISTLDTAAQSGLPTSFQYSISDVAPGTAGYSDLRRVIDVFVPADYMGQAPLHVRDIPSDWSRNVTQQEEFVNCPMVHRSTQLNTDVAAVTTAWQVVYRGLWYRCIFLSSNHSLYSDATVTQRVFFIRHALTNATLDNPVFEFSLDASNNSYSPFARVYTVSVPATVALTYISGTLASLADVAASGYPVVDTRTFVNYPIISAATTASPPATAAPTTAPTLDSSYFRYQYNQTLYNDGNNIRILLLWNYSDSSSTLAVRVIAYNMAGYVAIGFSDVLHSQMAEADIVLGYINPAINEGCIRSMYGQFATSAPSSTPTLQIRDSSIMRVGGALILTFTRDFKGGAHTAGVIPTRSTATGKATGRLIYATLNQYLFINCSAQAFTELYHGTAPHGSALVDWGPYVPTAAPTPIPPTTAPPTTAAPPAVLSPTSLSVQPVYYRGVLEQMVCAPLAVPVATRAPQGAAEESVGEFGFPVFPPWYIFREQGVTKSTILPLITDFPGSSSNYSGAWQVIYIDVPAATQLLMANVTSMASLTALLASGSQTIQRTASDDFLHCPVVATSTTITDASIRRNAPTQQVFYEGQLLTCLQFSPISRWGETSATVAAQIAPMWSVTLSSSSKALIPIIDDVDARFFAIVSITLSTVGSSSPSTMSSVEGIMTAFPNVRNPNSWNISSSSRNIVHCQVQQPLNRTTWVSTNTTLTTSNNQSLVTVSLPPVTISLQSGLSGNRSVSFYAIPSSITTNGRCTSRRGGWQSSSASPSSTTTSTTSTRATLYLVRNTSLPQSSSFSSSLVRLLQWASNASTNPLEVIQTVSDVNNSETFVSSTILTGIVDAAPEVNATYCDGVWNVVLIDVSALMGVTPPENTSILPSWMPKNYYYTAGSDANTYVPWWANANTLQMFVANTTTTLSTSVFLNVSFHCPLINRTSTFSGGSESTKLMERLSLLVFGYRVDCVNLGLLEASTTAPILFNPVTPSQRLPVLEAVPGSPSFSTIFWQVDVPATSSLSSASQLTSASLVNWTRAMGSSSLSQVLIPFKVVYVAILWVGALPLSSFSSGLLYPLNAVRVRSPVVGTLNLGSAASRAGNVDVATPSSPYVRCVNYTQTDVFPKVLFRSVVQCFHRSYNGGVVGDTTTLMTTAPSSSSVSGTVYTASLLSAVYVFKRSSSIGGTPVAQQRPIATDAPFQTFYHRTNGTWGYSDVKRVVIVVVPYTYQGPEITQVSDIPSSWIQNRSTGLVAHLFLAASMSATAFVSSPEQFVMRCPATMVWARGSLYNSVDCGWSRDSQTMIALQTSYVGGDAMSSSSSINTSAVAALVGSSVMSLVPISTGNTFLTMPFTIPVVDAWRISATSSFAAASLITNLSTSSAGLVKLRVMTVPSHFPVVDPSSTAGGGAFLRKYVFRTGPSLFSSDRSAITPSILTSSSNTSSATTSSSTSSGRFRYSLLSRVYVVNVGDYSADEIAALELRSEADVLAASRRNGWPIFDSELYEVGGMLYPQVNVSDDVLAAAMPQRSMSNQLRCELVYVDGVARRHVSSTRYMQYSEVASRILSTNTASSVAASVDAVRAADGTMILRNTSVATGSPLARVLSVPAASFSGTSPDTVFPTIVTATTSALVNNSVAAAAASWSVVQIVEEDFVAYTPLPQPRALRRSVGWYQQREVIYYAFSDAPLAHPEAPAPLFVFRRVSSNGGALSTVGSPLVDALPGHATYNDLHDIYYCDFVSPASTASAPTSIAGMRQLILAGILRPPVRANAIKFTPLVHMQTTVDSRDRKSNGGSIDGPLPVVYENLIGVVGYLQFGAVTMISGSTGGITSTMIPSINGFSPELSQAVQLVWELNQLQVPDGVLFNSIPFDNATLFSYVRSVSIATVSSSVLPHTITSVDQLSQVAMSTVSNVRNVTFGIVSISTPIDAATDDYPLGRATPIAVSWSYGPVTTSTQTGPASWGSVTAVTLGDATNYGSGVIHFLNGTVLSGSAAVAPPIPSQNVTNANVVRLGDAFTLQWDIGTLSNNEQLPFVPATTSSPSSTTAAGTKSRVFTALDATASIATFAPTELYAQFNFTVTADVWVGLGLTTTASMAGADMWLGYASSSSPSTAPLQSQLAGGGGYYQLTDRTADALDPHSTPVIDSINNLELISVKLTTTGYQIVFRRPLVISYDPDNVNLPILDETQTFVWAYGLFDLSSLQPLPHTNRGFVYMNLYTGHSLIVPTRSFSYWYIALTAALGVFFLLMCLVLRVVPPGGFMYKRPFLRMKVLSTAWRRSTLAESLVLVGLLGLSCAWGYGCWTDFFYSRRDNAIALAIGSVAQFYLYFAYLPLSRFNILLTGFARVSWHKMQHWTCLLGFVALGLGWGHGIRMMIVNPTGSFETTRGICSIAGLAVWTVLHLSLFYGRSRMLRIVFLCCISAKSRRWHTLRLSMAIAVIVLLCIHTPRLAIGWAPLFFVVAIDHVRRWKNYRTQFGYVSAVGQFGRNITAFELLVHSTWSRGSWFRRPFTSSPGQLMLLDIDGVQSGILPLTMSSRVLQDPKLDTASVTFHCKALPDADDENEGDPAAEVCALAQSHALQGRFVRLEGPYGGISLRLKWYRSLVLIGGGMGAASSLSLLETLVFQPDYFSSRTSLESITLVLVSRSRRELTVFATELLEVLRSPRPFDLQVLLFVTGPNGGLSPKPAVTILPALERISGATTQPQTQTKRRPLVQLPPPTASSGVNTTVKKTIEFQNIYEAASPPTKSDVDDGAHHDFSPIAPSHVTLQPTTELLLQPSDDDHPLFQLVTLHTCRPNWAQLIAAEQIAAGTRGDDRIAVHVNGPSALTQDVLDTCESLSTFYTQGIQVHCDFELFPTSII